LHGELMERALDGLRDIKDQMQVHGAILCGWKAVFLIE
jgi:hypothetical protein